MIWSDLRKAFASLIHDNDLDNQSISIRCAALSAEEALGRPEHGDYVLQKGRERIVEASLAGARGHAFSDTPGDWKGTAGDLLTLELTSNFRRAVFVSSLNAIMRYLGLLENSIHCRDDGPARCGPRCAEAMRSEFPRGARIALIGYQPRICESLAQEFAVGVVDMDPRNIGKTVGNAVIYGPAETERVLADAQVVLATGSTLVNDTISVFLGLGKPTIFYGVSVAGAAQLLGLRHYCPLST